MLHRTPQRPFDQSLLLENLLTEKKFGEIEVQQNHLVESPDLSPRFHLKALEYLKERCV